MVLIAVVWQELALDNPYATHLLCELLQDCSIPWTWTLQWRGSPSLPAAMTLRLYQLFPVPAHSQVLNAVNVFSSNYYGSMLLDLNVKMAG